MLLCNLMIFDGNDCSSILNFLAADQCYTGSIFWILTSDNSVLYQAVFVFFFYLFRSASCHFFAICGTISFLEKTFIELLCQILLSTITIAWLLEARSHLPTLGICRMTIPIVRWTMFSHTRRFFSSSAQNFVFANLSFSRPFKTLSKYVKGS